MLPKPEPFVKPDMIFSVSDASALLKNVVETAFPELRIRGELSQITLASSGHMYMTIKDSNAAINAIIWRGTPVNFKLEDGMDVLGDAIDSIQNKGKVIYFSPRGKVLNQKMVHEYLKHDTITLLCGRYEGIDQRIIDEYDIEAVSQMLQK